MARHIAIGDIHGCRDALDTLLEAIAPGAEDCLITLGDYVDRGPDVRGVLDILLNLERATQLTALAGNHELLMLEARAMGEASPLWRMCGGSETLDSYGGSLDSVPQRHWDFLEGCVLTHETSSHFFIHANYDPDLPLSAQPETLALWTHLSEPLTPPHSNGKTAIVGHTPQAQGVPLLTPHLICVDTCCFGGGWLTAMDIHSRQIWQANQQGALREWNG